MPTSSRGDLDGDTTCDKRIFLFDDDDALDYLWYYDNSGLKNAQVWFFAIPQTIGLNPLVDQGAGGASCQRPARAAAWRSRRIGLTSTESGAGSVRRRTMPFLGEGRRRATSKA